MAAGSLVKFQESPLGETQLKKTTNPCGLWPSDTEPSYWGRTLVLTGACVLGKHSRSGDWTAGSAFRPQSLSEPVLNIVATLSHLPTRETTGGGISTATGASDPSTSLGLRLPSL